MSIRGLIAACMLLSLGAAVMTAQEVSVSPTQFGFDLGIGTETVPEDPTDPASEVVTFQKLSLQPNFSFGKFGVGLDISVHFNLRFGSGEDGVEFYSPDWIPDDAGKTFWELYLPKIAYVSWGQKGDPLYAKLGSFTDGTLGNGFIMGNYANTSFLPETRIFGAALDMDGRLFDFPVVGVETFVGNIARFDVIGGRVYGRPLSYTAFGMFKELQLGTTYVVDREPQLHDGNDDNDDDGDSVAVFGADFRQALFENRTATMATFGDVAFQNEGRWGSALGVGGAFVRIVPYTLQIQALGSGFMPTYFNATYDVFRSSKYAIMKAEPENRDVEFGWLASLGLSLLGDKVFINVSADGPFKAAPDNGSINDYPHVRGVFTVADGFLAGFSVDASYEKYMLGADEGFWKDLVGPENAVIGARISYTTGPAMLSLMYNLRYDPATGGYIVTSSLMTTIRF